MILNLPRSVEQKLKAYRKRRREERGGKVLHVQSAILEILASVLDEEPVRETTDYETLVELVADIQGRIRRLEDKVLP